MADPDNEGAAIDPAKGADPVGEAWEELSHQERWEFRHAASRMKEQLEAASSPEDAEQRALEVLDGVSSPVRDKLLEALLWGKKHGWDDRTWAQRLMLLSLIPAVPLAAGKAAGAAIGRTALRVAAPVVVMAGASLVGALVDALATKKKR
jgi:hypothetical protein